MELFEAIKSRRSIRSYTEEEEVRDEEVDRIPEEPHGLRHHVTNNLGDL